VPDFPELEARGLRDTDAPLRFPELPLPVVRTGIKYKYSGRMNKQSNLPELSKLVEAFEFESDRFKEDIPTAGEDVDGTLGESERRVGGGSSMPGTEAGSIPCFAAIALRSLKTWR
jgi:hypothetical protein